MKPTVRLCVAALVAATASCSGMNVPKTYVLSPDTGNGLAVFSLSSNGPQAGVFYRRVGEKGGTGLDMWRINLRLDWHDPPGRLVVIEVPAGPYEIYTWRAINLMGVGYAEPTRSFSIPFTVVPGRATYLGNIHLEFGSSRAAVLTLDRRARDLPLLHSRYPALLDEYVDIKIARVHAEGTATTLSNRQMP